MNTMNILRINSIMRFDPTQNKANLMAKSEDDIIALHNSFFKLRLIMASLDTYACLLTIPQQRDILAHHDCSTVTCVITSVGIKIKGYQNHD